MFFLSRNDLQRRKNLKRFKNSKFALDKFVNQYYIDDDGYAYVSARVRGYHDVISPYSIKGYEWLNADFASYLEESAYYIPIEERVALEICGCKFSEEQKKVITNTVTTYYKLKLGDMQLDLNDNTNHSFIMIALGIITLAGYTLLSTYGGLDFAAELVSLAFWVMMWEGIDLILFDRKELVSKKMDAAQLANMKVVFNENEK